MEKWLIFDKIVAGKKIPRNFVCIFLFEKLSFSCKSLVF
ncbi:hypothetical protein NPIRD3C_0293 [Nitrosopumilus piranensis]|uniref:Uncharacterized protein n=1 Tax=Nitrosopumilus piranensis TaxID=1582439 RepID=A0A0C5BTC7_9ARCH|nr:hypothetical protein NPIRD3C_0293 [Nitrosopumilus piranensis]